MSPTRTVYWQFTLFLGLATFAHAAPCAQKTWTTAADFADGSATNRVKGVNLYTDPASPDKIAINTDGPSLKPLPYLCVALSSAGTIARIDTQADPPAIVGVYYSAPGNEGRNPSRTSVDLFGSVYAANRGPDNSATRSAVKIGLVIGGTRNSEFLDPPFDYVTCIDRNSDGRIRTSSGLANVLA